MILTFENIIKAKKIEFLRDLLSKPKAERTQQDIERLIYLTKELEFFKKLNEEEKYIQ